MRLLVLALLIGTATAGPHGSPPVPLRDIKPTFVRAASRLYRSRTRDQAGLFVRGKRYRGLAFMAPGRVGFDLDRAFTRLTVRIAVLDGHGAAVRFRILGDGKPLVATPPLFAGSKPLSLDVPLRGVVLLELAAEGGQARVAFLDGKLRGADVEKLKRFRAMASSFSPEEYLPSFKRRINRAIDKAVGHLLVHQGPHGVWQSDRDVLGTTALVSLALLKAGVKCRDPSIQRAFQFLRGKGYHNTYAVAVLIMAIEAAYFPRGADPRSAAERIPDADQRWIRAAAEWLAQQQGAGFPKEQRAFHPVWRYPRAGYDLSCTQYALFGLSAARRCGVAQSGVWLPALRYILGAQEREGPRVVVSRYFRAGRFMRRHTERAKARGFGYQLESRPTGAMTSAGLCSLILCGAALSRNAKYQRNWRDKTRVAIRDAHAWLEEYYDIDENPFHGSTWWTYYLFNLERAGVLLDQRYLGTRDWYREGSVELMKRQDGNGRIGGDVIDTSFALLFLKRATVPPLTQTR